MRNLQHNAGAVAILAYLGTTMTHVLQYPQGIVHQLVALVAVDIYHHANATRIVFITALVQSLSWLVKFTFCHIILVLSYNQFLFGCKIMTK